MRLSYVEIAGFRGFKDVTRFNFPAGFAVLTGRNGAGKSTVLDAVDYAFTGTINKFAVKGAKGGGLDSHIWWVGEGLPTAHYVEVGFINDEGVEVRVNRNRERGLQSPLDNIGSELCADWTPSVAWPNTLMQTTLIRDETLAGLSLDLPEQARFEAVRAAIGGLTGPDHSARASDVVKAANAAKTVQDAKLEHLKAELGRALSALTEARSIAERQTDVAEAEKIILRLVPNLDDPPALRAEQLRRRLAERKESVPALTELILRAEAACKEQAYLSSDQGVTDRTKLVSELTDLERRKALAAEELKLAETALAAEREADSFAAHLIALLDHGEHVGLVEGHCPLCESAKSEGEFATAIATARSRLSARGRAAAQVMEKFEQAQVTVSQIDFALDSTRQSLAELDRRAARATEDLAAVQSGFKRFGLGASSLDPEEARHLLLEHQEETAQLERAVFILEASGAHDRVTALETRVSQLRVSLEQETGRATAAERAVEMAKQIDNATKSVANQILTEQFDTVMPLLKELYQRLRPHTDWREIETDFGGKVRASLNFTVGEGCNPQFLFSSGQRRAAGLAFLLAIHLSRPWCRLRTLLMDDPVQHIDDYRALNLVEVLSGIRRMGRQVIVAVEDSTLADLLCRRLRSTFDESGRRFDLCLAPNGSASIGHQTDIHPLPREILKAREAS